MRNYHILVGIHFGHRPLPDSVRFADDRTQPTGLVLNNFVPLLDGHQLLFGIGIQIILERVIKAVIILSGSVRP